MLELNHWYNIVVKRIVVSFFLTHVFFFPISLFFLPTPLPFLLIATSCPSLCFMFVCVRKDSIWSFHMHSLYFFPPSSIYHCTCFYYNICIMKNSIRSVFIQDPSPPPFFTTSYLSPSWDSSLSFTSLTFTYPYYYSSFSLSYYTPSLMPSYQACHMIFYSITSSTTNMLQSASPLTIILLISLILSFLSLIWPSSTPVHTFSHIYLEKIETSLNK